MKRKISKKSAAIILSVSLLLGATLGSTLAWLTDTTEEVTNTFTVSNVKLELTETTGDEYKMIPGWTMEKNPIVTVKEGSEDCWIFIKVKESSNLDDYINYEIDTNNWTKLDTEDNSIVYYCYAKDITADRSIKVLLNNQVTTKDAVTEEMMEVLNVEGAEQPELSFTAYAAQYYKTNDTAFTAAEAWNSVKNLDNTSTN